MAVLLEKRLRDEADGWSWTKREWSGWLKDLQTAEDGYEQMVNDMCKWVELSPELQEMFQKHDGIFSFWTREPPHGSSQMSQAGGGESDQREGVTQTPKPDSEDPSDQSDNESYGTVKEPNVEARAEPDPNPSGVERDITGWAKYEGRNATVLERAEVASLPGVAACSPVAGPACAHSLEVLTNVEQASKVWLNTTLRSIRVDSQSGQRSLCKGVFQRRTHSLSAHESP